MGLGSSVQKPTVNMSGESATFVKDKIRANKVMIFSKTFCPFCKIAKQSFDQLRVQYEVLELDQHPKGSEIQDILHEMTGNKSVPRVFVGGDFIGGGTETRDLLKSGALKKLIDECE